MAFFWHILSLHNGSGFLYHKTDYKILHYAQLLTLVLDELVVSISSFSYYCTYERKSYQVLEIVPFISCYWGTRIFMTTHMINIEHKNDLITLLKWTNLQVLIWLADCYTISSSGAHL